MTSTESLHQENHVVSLSHEIVTSTSFPNSSVVLSPARKQHRVLEDIQSRILISQKKQPFNVFVEKEVTRTDELTFINALTQVSKEWLVWFI